MSGKTAIKSDPELWRKIQIKWKKSSKGGKPNEWNARKAQLAVQEYKRLGGKYSKPKNPQNSLVKWTREDWGYIDGKPGNRYLPKAVAKSLTPAEKRATNLQKKRATAKGVQRAPYSKSLITKMHAAKVL